MIKHQYFTIIIMSLLLSACTVLPKTSDQVVYATYGAYITIANTTADLLDQGAITPERAIKIQAELRNVRPTMDVAVALLKRGKPVPGDVLQTLELAQALLIEIQKELQSRIPQ